ncbi:uncharacterized protein L201_002693 [Kwoniella dendrophila CBS 6074]|uniref:Uncharacterized protein n=1 Tax=Kwoniella dendrophila CBS 6074 TaxID=1295534 RepID=A0AAX4JRQ8_9TREE
MRFTSPNSKPSLTPAGYKLLHLSEKKLSYLDGSLYDEGPALLKGVLVKESIKSAWKSVQEGSVVEMNDWTSLSAMGLDVVSEDDEDDEFNSEIQSGKEERWFEDLVSSFGEDDFDQPQSSQLQEEHEWVESNVTEPVFDEFDYDSSQIEAFTFPTPSSSPTSIPVDTTSSVPKVIVTDVDVVEVSDDDDEEEEAVDLAIPSHHHHSIIETFGSISQKSVMEQSIASPSLDPVSSHGLVPPSPIEAITSDWDESIYLYPQPYYTDFDDYIDDFSLPPPLIRSLSSSSTSTIDPDEEKECGTPPLRCSELDEQPSWLDQLKHEDTLPVDSNSESDVDQDDIDDIAVRRFTEDDDQGKVLGGIVGMALGFDREGLVLC